MRHPGARPILVIDERGQLAAVGAEPDDVAVAQLGERAAAQRLGADMDRRRNLAAGARHAPVGDQRDLEAAVLQHAERRRQLVQLGHAVGARSLEAHHHHHVAVELAGLERGQHLILVGEDPRRRLDRPARRVDRAGLEGRAAEIACTSRMPPSGRKGLATGRSMVSSSGAAGAFSQTSLSPSSFGSRA